MKTDYIYTIARGYRHLTIIEACPKTRQRISTLIVTPQAHNSRKGKFETICACLKRVGIPAPAYKPTKAESK